jgi:hypothetical protein
MNWTFLIVVLLAIALMCVLVAAARTRKSHAKRRSIGFSQSGQVLHYPGSGHLITIAPTRICCRREVLIPALLDMPDKSIPPIHSDECFIDDEDLRKGGLI